MDDPQTRLLATLQFLMTSDIPSEHKGVLIETVTQALREHGATSIRDQAAAAAHAIQEWQAAETEQLNAYLQGRVASSWQQADEVALHLAVTLKRNPHEIRAKAMELGFGPAVDFRLARAKVRAESE